jgi:hypothetical protein
MLRDRDILIYAAIGLSVWLNGALTFWLGGGALFESGPWVTAASALGIAIAVCLVLRSTMAWRKADPALSVTVAVVMALPGLFGEAARQLVFAWTTGLSPATQPAFAATIFFGNAVLLTYAVLRARAARRAG